MKPANYISRLKTSCGLTIVAVVERGKLVATRVTDQDGKPISWAMPKRVVDAFGRNAMACGERVNR